MANNLSLLGGTNRVEIPFIKVTFGDRNSGYTFGVYQKTTAMRNNAGFVDATKIVYPNYIQSLQVQKINGQVNTYTLNITYPITPLDDPNFFEKIFSSISNTRKVFFTYGDMNLPTFVYKEEEAIITDIKTAFDLKSSIINYTVSAVSSAALAASGCYTFVNQGLKKPSDEIKKLLFNAKYGLQEIFYGMNNRELVEQEGLIAGDDQLVELMTQTNISALDYLKYLISCMIPSTASVNSRQRSFYILTVVDDITGKFGGPYFKIVKNTNNIQNSDAYEIDIGYPSKDIVLNFQIQNNENWSIFYDWNQSLNSEEYVRRLNEAGQWEDVYAPIVSSKNSEYKTKINDSVWWSKLTEYPISATISLKGLLRPAILMTHVRLNVYFYGVKHISSGLYIVTKQTDTVNKSGYRTELALTRIAGD